MTFAAAVRIAVSAHALKQARARFGPLTERDIEGEVRAALHDPRRLAVDRRVFGLDPGSDPTCLYAQGDDGRVYALRVNDHDEGGWIVTTAMQGTR